MSNKRARKINKNITAGKLSSSLWRLATPMMIAALLQDLFTLADLFFVGRLGHIAVAALSISGVILSVIMMVAIGISSGATALIAHFTGKKDYTNADRVLFQVVVISFISSAVMVLVGISGTVELLRIFGATKEIISSACGYLKINFIFSIFIFLFIGFNQTLRGSGDAVTPLKILILSNAVNILLDPLFIFGFWFFPRLEVAGSAVATVISRAMGVVILLCHFMYGHSSLHFYRDIFKINLPIIKRIVSIGFFASFEVLLRQISLLLLLRFIAVFGAVSLAAYGIVLRLRMAVIMLGLGMGSACGVLIGQNMGAGLSKRAVKSGWVALKYYELIILPLALIFFIFAPHIIGVFNNHPDVVKIGSNFLRLMAITLPFLASALVLGRGISGAGDTVAPAVMTGIVQLGLRIPSAFIMAFIFGLGINGIWLGINISDICQSIAMLWYFKGRFWQKRYYQHRSILEAENVIIT
ncbi:MAG: MATE family efflux transporter [Candidatus Omnitrophica bacterium]|nr:MATE family efflux transporter [Candidatus Omnitrophota bacterium]